MPANLPVGHPWLHIAVAAGLLLPLYCSAQTVPQGRTATSSFSVRITIRPQFRILETRPVAGGHEYRVWTNMKSVQLNGQEYRFEHVGEATVVVPGALIEAPADQAAPALAQQGS